MSESKNKVVSNTSLALCKLLDLMEQEEVAPELVDRNAYKWSKLFESIRIQAKKKASDTCYEVDITSQDMVAVQDAFNKHLEKFSSKISYQQFLEELLSIGTLHADEFTAYLGKITVRSRAAGILRDLSSLASYWAIVFRTMEDDDKLNSDLGFVLTETLQSELKNLSKKW